VSGRPAPASPLERRERLLIVLVVLFSAGLFLFRLGSGSLWDLDEPRYAEASREILTTGDWLTMHLGGRPWFGPSPLWMWVLAATGRVAGFTELTVRIWAAVFGVVGVVAAYALGREWFGPRTGILSGLILATMLEYLVLSRLAIPDVMEVAWLLLALHAFYRGYRDRRRGDYLRAFLYAALATLSRGVGAVLLLILVLWPFLAYRRVAGRWREIPWGWGTLLYLAVAAPWYVLEIARSGPAFAIAVLGGGTVSRVAHAAAAQAGSILYDVPVLILGAVPWTAFLPGALVFHYYRRWQDGSLLCLLWCAVVFAMALVAGARLPDDIFPLYPLAAIAIARLWEAFLFEGAGRLRRILVTSFVLQIGVVVVLILAAVTFATGRYPREWTAVRGAIGPPIAVLVLGPAVTAVLFALRRYTAAFLALPAAMAVFVGLIYTVTMPVIETQKPMKPLALALARRLRPGDRVIGYRLGTSASLIYYANHPVESVEDPGALHTALCVQGRAFLVATKEDLDAARTELPRDLMPVDNRGDLVVRLKPAGLACGGEP
jgi:4-amino-4-deoxy-L-arabinose transferase-like glycosyltransferase